MSTPSQNTYDIPSDGYIAFDALSLRQLIVNRLNEQGTFTDQNFVGSNLASIIDIIAYSYHSLIYYLNKTSTESMFSEAQLYENMNRIVKLIDFKPIGFQTSTLTFQASTNNVSQLPVGLYTIPRYSFLQVNNIPLCFNEDITYAKTKAATEPLTTLSQEKFLYQGRYVEYPVYTAAGDDNEILIVDTAGTLVDHFNIDVYVYSKQNNKWSQYSATNSLYLENGSAFKYEIRLNPNQRYEIKFGNDINGKKLKAGDQVAVYYLKSDGADGAVGANVLEKNPVTLIRFNTTQYNSILSDIVGDQNRFLTSEEIGSTLTFANNSGATTIKASQTTEEIRNVAPSNFRSQYRLVTVNDYRTFIKTNFANLVTDIQVVNNSDYVAQYLKYFHALGVNNPVLTDRALINQILYSDSCSFNNIYLITVPRSNNATFNYLAPAQKQLIKTSIADYKVTTTETTFIDPVYKAVSIGVAKPGISLYPPGDLDCIQLQVTRLQKSARNKQAIVNDITNIIKKYFNRDALALGQTIDTRSITQQILAVDGVQTFYTARTDVAGVKTEGLSLFVWNPVYPYQDAVATASNVTLNFFEFPYYNNLNNISNFITVTN